MKISVVIPAYNEELQITDCLESLVRQSRPADEIIVVDNNSTDQTAAFAAASGAKVVSESRQGIWAAASTGYDAAAGDIIARCDADSRLPVDWLVRIEESFDADPKLGAVTGPGVFYDTGVIGRRAAAIWYMRAYFLTVGAALAHPPLFGSNMAMRRSLWTEVRGETHVDREDIHDDIDLSYHIGRHGRIRYDNNLKVGISYRPMRALGGLPGRYTKGFRSIFIHWPQEAPWIRIRRRARRL